MALEGRTERTNCRDELRSRPLVRRQQDFVHGQWLRVGDDADVLLQELRDERRAAACDVEDDARRAGARGALADVLARDLHDRFSRRQPRDRFLHEGILELGGPDLAQREIEARGVQGCARRQPVPLHRLHAAAFPGRGGLSMPRNL